VLPPLSASTSAWKVVVSAVGSVMGGQFPPERQLFGVSVPFFTAPASKADKTWLADARSASSSHPEMNLLKSLGLSCLLVPRVKQPCQRLCPNGEGRRSHKNVQSLEHLPQPSGIL
jgi:hypothetical protein